MRTHPLTPWTTGIGKVALSALLIALAADAAPASGPAAGSGPPRRRGPFQCHLEDKKGHRPGPNDKITLTNGTTMPAGAYAALLAGFADTLNLHGIIDAQGNPVADPNKAAFDAMLARAQAEEQRAAALTAAEKPRPPGSGQPVLTAYVLLPNDRPPSPSPFGEPGLQGQFHKTIGDPAWLAVQVDATTNGVRSTFWMTQNHTLDVALRLPAALAGIVPQRVGVVSGALGAYAMNGTGCRLDGSLSVLGQTYWAPASVAGSHISRSWGTPQPWVGQRSVWRTSFLAGSVPITIEAYLTGKVGVAARAVLDDNGKDLRQAMVLSNVFMSIPTTVGGVAYEGLFADIGVQGTGGIDLSVRTLTDILTRNGYGWVTQSFIASLANRLGVRIGRVDAYVNASLASIQMKFGNVQTLVYRESSNDYQLAGLAFSSIEGRILSNPQVGLKWKIELPIPIYYPCFDFPPVCNGTIYIPITSGQVQLWGSNVSAYDASSPVQSFDFWGDALPPA